MKTARQYYYKWLAGILLFALILTCAALPAYAGTKDSFNSGSNSQDRISISDHAANPVDDTAFKIVILNDYDTGKTLGRCCVPVDFSVDYQFLNSLMSGSECSIACPYQVVVNSASSDYARQFYYRSGMYYMCPGYEGNYHEGERYGVRENAMVGYPTMVMLYPYTAQEYADHIVQQKFPDNTIYYDGTVYITGEEDPDLAKKAEQELAYSNTSNPFSFLFEVECTGVNTSYTESSYFIDDPLIPQEVKIVTATYNYFFRAVDKTLGKETTYSITCVPYFYMCCALDSQKEEALAQFDVFVANTRTTDEFNIVNHLESQALYEIVNQGWSSIDEQALGESLGEGYGSYYEDQFTDYILDQNDYTTSDGRSFKVPTSFDYVYETDNGEIYVTNTTEQPAGSTRLYAN